MNQFIIQYALVILTIVLIPVLLRIGKSKNVAKLTYGVFGLLIVGNLCAYFFLDAQPSYIYLSIILLLSSFFVKRKKCD